MGQGVAGLHRKGKGREREPSLKAHLKPLASSVDLEGAGLVAHPTEGLQVSKACEGCGCLRMGSGRGVILGFSWQEQHRGINREQRGAGVHQCSQGRRRVRQRARVGQRITKGHKGLREDRRYQLSGQWRGEGRARDINASVLHCVKRGEGNPAEGAHICCGDEWEGNMHCTPELTMLPRLAKSVQRELARVQGVEQFQAWICTNPYRGGPAREMQTSNMRIMTRVKAVYFQYSSNIQRSIQKICMDKGGGGVKPCRKDASHLGEKAQKNLPAALPQEKDGQGGPGTRRRGS